MEKVLPSIAGYLIGFTISSLIWGKVEGNSGLIPNLRIPLGTKILLLHHWVAFAVLLIIVLIFRSQLSNRLFYLLLGIIIGGLHQGLTYKDWYVFLK